MTCYVRSGISDLAEESEFLAMIDVQPDRT